MGVIRVPLQILCFFLSILISSPVHSRKIEKAPKPSLLDVAASIRRSNEILSFNPDTLQQQQVQKQTNSSSSSSSFAVKLYSRDILSASKFKSYRELALSRIESDAVRVNFLYKKLNIALGRNMTSDMSELDVNAPLTSAKSKGAYVAQIGIGTPPQTLYTLIDTGSEVTWVHCDKRANPVFDPSSSSSYKPLQCNSSLCNQLGSQAGGCSDTNTCLYQIMYLKGSSAGEFATETLTLGSSAINDIAIGCDYKGDPVLDGVGSLFGLGRRSLSFPSQTKMSSFSYCLVDRDSTASSTLDFGSLVIPNEAITTPLLGGGIKDELYFVGLTGISVDGKMIPLQPSAFGGGAIVDSGTTLTLLPTEVYNVFRDEFVKGIKGFEPIAGIRETRFDLTSRTSDMVPFPAVAFHFGTKTLSLPAKSTVIPEGENNFLFAFEPIGAPFSILGNVLQQEMLVSFDVGNSLIGFTPSKC